MNINKVLEKTRQIRAFELKVAQMIKDKLITIPTYLSIGQEHIAAFISEIFPDSYIFPQHRCHSWYLAYGGSEDTLLKQLQGIVDEDSNGMQGSASLAIPDKMFGHSGLLGDQIPIAVGFADSKKQHTICVCGDAAVEEDYALGALGYAATKNVPILFIVEDNNLSILTEKKVRRSWDIVDIANEMGIYSNDIPDNIDILRSLESWRNVQDRPCLININTTRHYWHAGAGQDFISSVDRLQDLEKYVSEHN